METDYKNLKFFIFRPNSSDLIANEIFDKVINRLKNENCIVKEEHDISLEEFEKVDNHYELDYSRIETIFNIEFDCFFICWSNETDLKYHSSINACSLYWQSRCKKILCIYEKQCSNIITNDKFEVTYFVNNFNNIISSLKG